MTASRSTSRLQQSNTSDYTYTKPHQSDLPLDKHLKAFETVYASDMYTRTVLGSAPAASAGLVSASGHFDLLHPREHKQDNAPRGLVKRAFTGTGTWYDAETGQQGACGGFLKNTGATVALGFANYESGKHCGRKVTITYGGVTREAEVRDACEACQWGDIDLTPSLFQAFAHHDQGIFAATWWFSDEKAPTSDPPASSKPPAPSSKPASQPAAQPQPSTTRPQSSQQQSQQPAPSNSGASHQGSNSQGHSDAASVTSTGLAPSSTDKDSDYCASSVGCAGSTSRAILSKNVTTSAFASGDTTMIATLSTDALGAIQTIGVGKINEDSGKDVGLFGVLQDIHQVVLQLGTVVVESAQAEEEHIDQSTEDQEADQE